MYGQVVLINTIYCVYQHEVCFVSYIVCLLTLKAKLNCIKQITTT